MKFLFGIALALGIAAAAYGAAATLIVNGGAAQAGSAVVSCDTDGVSISYEVNAGLVDSISVSGIAEACAGNDVVVTVTGTGDAANLTGSLANLVGTSVTCGVSEAVNPADILTVSVAIIGNAIPTLNCVEP